MIAKTFESKVGSLPYRIHVPEKAEGPVPLVVFLHGMGERGDDNRAQLRHGVKSILGWCRTTGNEAVILAPQCPTDDMWAALDMESKTLSKKEKPTRSLALVLELVGKLMAEPGRIDPKRVYLTGLSMGGYGTWDALWRRPSRFAAAIPICGGGLTAEAPAIKDVPLWVFHGTKDGGVPVLQSQRMVAALKMAGGHPKFTEYPEAGHDSWTATYANPEVLKWLFAQSK